MFTIGVVILTTLANLVIAVIALKRNPRSATYRLIAMLSIITALWTVFNYLALAPNDEETRLFWVRAVMFVTAPYGTVILLLADAFPGLTLSLRRKVLWGLVAFNLVTAILAVSPYMFTHVKNLSNNSFNLYPGPAIVVYAVGFMGFMGAGFVKLIKKYRSSVGLVKKQLWFFLTGLIISFSLLTATNFVAVVVFRSIQLTYLGPPFTLILFVFVMYAIVRHRFLDITSLAARTLFYTLLLAGVVGIEVFVVVIGSRIFPMTVDRTVIAALGSVLIVMGYSVLREAITRLTEKIFFQGGYDTDKLLNRLSHVMASTLLLEDLADLVLRELTLQMKISYAALYIPLGKSAGTWVKDSVGSSKLKFELGSVAAVLEYVMGNKLEAPLIFDEMSESDIKEVMRKERISVVMPLLVNGVLTGAAIFQEKESGDIYSDQDAGVLAILAPELAVAVKNALAYYEISLFNITLQEEVKKATAELVAANEKLKELDKLKDEFVSIASHELRTPLTAIKGWLWIILNKDKKLDKATEKDLQSAVQSSDRLIALVNDMLDVSRIEGGRIELRKAVFDVGELAGALAKDLQAKVEEKKLTLVLPKVGEKVEADKDKTYQVLMNLVGNSIKFTPEKGKIEIRVKRAGGKIEVEVADTGVGIKKEDLPKLFSKFGRLDNSLAGISQVPGTGLGLYLSRKLVELMGGEIRVESEEGRGSVFTFNLPSAKVK